MIPDKPKRLARHQFWSIASALDAIFWTIPNSERRARTTIRELASRLREHGRALGESSECFAGCDVTQPEICLGEASSIDARIATVDDRKAIGSAENHRLFGSPRVQG